VQRTSRQTPTEGKNFRFKWPRGLKLHVRRINNTTLLRVKNRASAVPWIFPRNCFLHVCKGRKQPTGITAAGQVESSGLCVLAFRV